MEKTRNPFPGLRPFKPEETHLFFGRERETDELLRRLGQHRFLAVLGGSGSGKSSLVRTGLIPALYAGFMTRAGSRWRVASLRPGSDPIGNLAEALGGPGVLSDDDAAERTDPIQIEATLRSSRRGLADAVRYARLPAGSNLLIFVDQFEELFRFRNTRGSTGTDDDALAFVKLLIDAANCDEVPVYVVLTMRAGFIGDCIRYPRLPEAINEGEFLVPGLRRDDLRRAITGPVAISGAQIADRLVVRLLNEVADHGERLPVLQHALMRTWERWAVDHGQGEPIDLRHYEAVGTMGAALSRHANQVLRSLVRDEEKKNIVSVVEQACGNALQTDEEREAVSRIVDQVVELQRRAYGAVREAIDGAVDRTIAASELGPADPRFERAVTDAIEAAVGTEDNIDSADRRAVRRAVRSATARAVHRARSRAVQKVNILERVLDLQSDTIDGLLRHLRVGTETEIALSDTIGRWNVLRTLQSSVDREPEIDPAISRAAAKLNGATLRRKIGEAVREVVMNASDEPDSGGATRQPSGLKAAIRHAVSQSLTVALQAGIDELLELKRSVHRELTTDRRVRTAFRRRIRTSLILAFEKDDRFGEDVDRALRKIGRDEIGTRMDRAAERVKRITRKLFQALTDSSGVVRDVRRPTSVEEASEICDAHVSEIVAIADRYRQYGTTFLTPSEEQPLRPESILDISHESLMRTWDRLIEWARTERESALLYLRLVRSAERYELGGGTEDLWSGNRLGLALHWLKEQRPGRAWARRYDPAYELALRFLERSRLAARRATRRLIYKRTALIAFIAAALAMIGACVYMIRPSCDRLKDLCVDPGSASCDDSVRTQLRDRCSVIVPPSCSDLECDQLMTRCGAEVCSAWPVPPNPEACAGCLPGICSDCPAPPCTDTVACSDCLPGICSDCPAPPGPGTVVCADCLPGICSDCPAPPCTDTVACSDCLPGICSDCPAPVCPTCTVCPTPSLSTESELLRKRIDARDIAMRITADRREWGLLALAAYELDWQARKGLIELYPTRYGSSCMDDPQIADSLRRVSRAPDSATAANVLWDIPGCESESNLPGSNSPIQSLALDPVSSTVATGSEDGRVHFLVADLQKRLEVWELAVDARDGAWRLFSASAETPGKPPAFPGEVRSLTLSPVRRLFAAGGSSGTLRVWDLRKCDLAQDLPGCSPGHMTLEGKSEVISLAFRPDGTRLASGHRDGSIQIWNTRHESPARWREDSTHSSATGPVFVTYDPTGRILGAAGETGVRLYTAAGEVRLLPAEAVDSLAFSPVGRLLAGGTANGDVIVWENQSSVDGNGEWKRVAELRGHLTSVNALEFSPQGDRLASGSSDGTLRLWDTRVWRARPTILRGHDLWVRALAFYPEGDRLISGSADRTVRLWTTRNDLLASDLCRRLGKLDKEVLVQEWNEWSRWQPSSSASGDVTRPQLDCDAIEKRVDFCSSRSADEPGTRRSIP